MRRVAVALAILALSGCGPEEPLPQPTRVTVPVVTPTTTPTTTLTTTPSTSVTPSDPLPPAIMVKPPAKVPTRTQPRPPVKVQPKVTASVTSRHRAGSFCRVGDIDPVLICKRASDGRYRWMR